MQVTPWAWNSITCTEGNSNNPHTQTWKQGRRLLCLLESITINNTLLTKHSFWREEWREGGREGERRNFLALTHFFNSVSQTLISEGQWWWEWLADASPGPLCWQAMVETSVGCPERKSWFPVARFSITIKQPLLYISIPVGRETGWLCAWD